MGKVFYFQPIKVDEYYAWLSDRLPELNAGELNYHVRKDGQHGVAIEVRKDSALLAYVYVRFLEWSRALKVKPKRHDTCTEELLEDILRKIVPAEHKIVKGGEDVDL